MAPARGDRSLGRARGLQLPPAFPQPRWQPHSCRAERCSPAAFTCHEQLLSSLIILKLSGLSDADNLCELIILWQINRSRPLTRQPGGWLRATYKSYDGDNREAVNCSSARVCQLPPEKPVPSAFRRWRCALLQAQPCLSVHLNFFTSVWVCMHVCAHKHFLKFLFSLQALRTNFSLLYMF